MKGQYSVERRGTKYYLYNEFGVQVPGKSAFSSDVKAVRELFKEAALLNRKLDDQSC